MIALARISRSTQSGAGGLVLAAKEGQTFAKDTQTKARSKENVSEVACMQRLRSGGSKCRTCGSM